MSPADNTLNKFWSLSVFVIFMNLWPLASLAMIGGHLAKGESNRWIVRLATKNLSTGESTSFCSGGLVNNHLVLTAEHCVRSFIPAENPEDKIFYIQIIDYSSVKNEHLAEILFETTVQTIALDQTIDGAALLLENPVPKSIVTEFPHILSREETQKLRSQKTIPVIAVGFGFYKMQKEESSIVAQALNGERHSIQLESSPDVNLLAHKTPMWLNHMRDNKGLAYGDSGGPLLVENKGQRAWIGIHSRMNPSFSDIPGLLKMFAKIELSPMNSVSNDLVHIACTLKEQETIPPALSAELTSICR